MRIDVFCHFFPARFLAERNKRAGSGFGTQYARYFEANPGLSDLDIRFRTLDQFPDVRQLLTIAGPNIESITEPRDTVELARMANDGLAELVAKYPDRFIGAAACLPMNDVAAALVEADRAIRQLGFRGVEIFTDICGKPLDRPEFFPLYEKMQEYDLPILLHPRRTNTTADYADEEIEVSRLHELRVAVRNVEGDGPAGVRRRARALSAAEDRHASCRRHGAVLQQTR